MAPFGRFFFVGFCCAWFFWGNCPTPCYKNNWPFVSEQWDRPEDKGNSHCWRWTPVSQQTCHVVSIPVILNQCVSHSCAFLSYYGVYETTTATPRTTWIKKWIYILPSDFTYESYDTLKSFTLFITIKTIAKLTPEHSDKFEIKIKKK